MGIRSAEEIEGFARKILIRYFCEADVEFLISTFADDIVWLGAGEMQKAWPHASGPDRMNCHLVICLMKFMKPGIWEAAVTCARG